ncbi:MAG: hypothetical protein IT380_14450 [Myxococcales bacterium]|nr:hypothetical protein [Myxococcales bacterium]
MNLARRDVVRGRATTPKLVELVPVAARVGPRAAYVLHVGSVELEVGADFDEPSLRRLLDLLKSC